MGGSAEHSSVGLLPDSEEEASPASETMRASRPAPARVAYSSSGFYTHAKPKNRGAVSWLRGRFHHLFRVWLGLPTACRALLVVGLVNMGLTIAYSTTTFAAGSEGEPIHFSVTTVVAAVSIWLCLIDAVIYENTFEMFAVVLVGILILLRVIWVLARQEAPFFLVLIWGIILTVTQGAELTLVILAHRQFGWRVLSHIGVDVRSDGRGAKLRAAVVANAFTAVYRLLLVLSAILTTITIVGAVEGPSHTRPGLIITSAVGFTLNVMVISATLVILLKAEPPKTKDSTTSTDAVRTSSVSNLNSTPENGQGGVQKATPSTNDQPSSGIFSGWCTPQAWWVDIIMPATLSQPIAITVLCTRDEEYWPLSAKLAMYVLSGFCVITSVMLFVLFQAAWAYRRFIVFRHGRLKMETGLLLESRGVSGTQYGDSRAALLPLQAGAWLGKPSARRAGKLRFFQLSRDSYTLRWGWSKYLRLFHVESQRPDREALTLMLTFVADAPLLLRFPDAETLDEWEKGLSVAIDLVLAPEDGRLAGLGPDAEEESKSVWRAVGQGLERALRLRGPLEAEEESRMERQKRRAVERKLTGSITDGAAAIDRLLDETHRRRQENSRNVGSGRQQRAENVIPFELDVEAGLGRKVGPSRIDAGGTIDHSAGQQQEEVSVYQGGADQQREASSIDHRGRKRSRPPSPIGGAAGEATVESRDADVAALYLAAMAGGGEGDFVLPGEESQRNKPPNINNIPLPPRLSGNDMSLRSTQTMYHGDISAHRAVVRSPDLSWMLQAGSQAGSVTLSAEASLGLASMAVDSVAPDELSFGQILGAGAEARVCAGWRHGLPVAIKIYVNEIDAEREVRAYLTAGPHPNVLSLHGLCRERGALLLVLDYCPRGSLDVLVHSSGGRPWDVRKLVRIVREIVAGLSHLHRRGILHRDLKPSNVLIGARNAVRLADLGCAKFVPGALLARAALQKPTPGVLGTVRYAAPELAGELSDTPIDPRSLLGMDIWSLGVVLWEMLARRRPYEGLTDTAVQARWIHKPAEARLPPLPPPLIGGGDPRVIGLVARELSQLCCECMTLDPGKRPTAEQVLRRVEALERHLEESAA